MDAPTYTKLFSSFLASALSSSTAFVYRLTHQSRDSRRGAEEPLNSHLIEMRTAEVSLETFHMPKYVLC